MGMIYGGSTYMFSKNLQGDVIGIYGPDRQLVAKYQYNAYGEITAITDANGNDISGNSSHIANINPFRYRGYYYDNDTGFYYLNSRYYDPEVGRFINADDVSVFAVEQGSLIQYNAFAYCLNDPISRTDESGMWSWKKLFKAFVIVAIVVVAVAVSVPTGGASIAAGAAASTLSATAAAKTAVAVGVVAIGAGVAYSKSSKQSGKERSTDKPSWVNKGMVDYSKSAHSNATRMMNDKFGPGNWTASTSDKAFSKILKWLTRSLGLKG